MTLPNKGLDFSFLRNASKAGFKHSLTSVLLPDPLTPVTAVNLCFGIAKSTPFKLCNLAPDK